MDAVAAMTLKGVSKTLTESACLSFLDNDFLHWFVLCLANLCTWLIIDHENVEDLLWLF